MTRTLVVGYGFLGRRVADLAVQNGDTVWVTSRDPRKLRAALSPAAGGVIPLKLDWTDQRTLANLPEVDRVLVSVSYDTGSRMSRYDSQVGGFANLLRVLSPAVNVCYISTTGVFHQHDGGWVDENSPARPTREGGRVHLQAESLLHRMRPDLPWTILRFSGIYGPGRIPRAADVIAGRPIPSPGNGYLNLIHVEDGAAAVMASMSQSKRRLYLISDDEPMRRFDFYRRIAHQVGAAEPTFIRPPIDASARMRSDSDKRVWNRRMKSDLLPRLKYPTYREGLADLL